MRYISSVTLMEWQQCIVAMFADARLLPFSSVLNLGCSMLAICIAD